MIDSISRLDASTAGVRRVMVDTLIAGAFWVEFEPGAMMRSVRAATPEAAAASFLGNYAAKVFGIGSGETELNLIKRRTDGDMTHFRYQQTYAAYAVLGGQLALHVRKVSGGYTIQSANGWLVPDVAAAVAPSFGRREAEVAALSAGSGGTIRAAWDTTPIIVPHETGTRLAYLVPVLPTSGEPVVRYVDAQTREAFAETPTDLSFSPFYGNRTLAIKGGHAPAPAAAASPQPRASTGTYMLVEGTNWFSQSRDFVVWFTGSVYQMADNNHPGTHEVRIHDMTGVSLNSSCTPSRPIVQRSSVPWPPVDDAPAREEVSAIDNLGASVTYFKDKFGRNGMHGNPSWNTYACVHAISTAWNAFYSPSDLTVRFRKETLTETPSGPVLDGPSVAAQDVATHEFMHGVSHTEIGGSGFSSDFESRAIEEALSDYFGARHRGVSTHAVGVKFSGPLRELNSTMTVNERYNHPDSGNNAHWVGIAFSSALWGTATSLPAAGGNETDWATYSSLTKNYMTATMLFWTGREAVVRAAKDRAHDNESLYPIAHQLETQFHDRGIGPNPITASLAETTCGQWTVGPSGGQITVALRFESGSSLNQDGSVNNPADSIDLGNYDPTTFPINIASSQVGWHTGADGHWHSIRLQFEALSNPVGYLNYYAGHGPYCGAFVVTATAPSFVTVKTTYQLTGSGNYPATGWLWEQSYNGGTYGFWSNLQNSSFLAYNGTYTLDWRLSATRTYDSDPDTAWTTTQVCIPFNPSCYAVRAADQEVARHDSATLGRGFKVTRDHFGSGLWIAIPQGARRSLIRMYSFSGRHDSSTTAVPWPNILERDGGDWTYATPSGALTLASRRHQAGENRNLLRLTGRFTGRGTRTLALGLAADPDLGEPADDALGFDPDLGVVWVRDGASGRHVGYLALAGTPTARVQQFGAGLDDAPEAPDAALRLMTAPTRAAAGQVADVRFLLTGPEVALRGDGAFDATFAVLHATSEEALLDLARATRRDAATLLAGTSGQSPSLAADAFGLRQSLGTTSLAASGAGTTASAVAQLQADGLTALDYRVPTGQEARVRIRLYNSRGQLVRTLVDQQVAGGSYHIQWDRLNERGQPVSPGVYVAVMEAGGFRATRKLVVTR